MFSLNLRKRYGYSWWYEKGDIVTVTDPLTNAQKIGIIISAINDTEDEDADPEEKSFIIRDEWGQTETYSCKDLRFICEKEIYNSLQRILQDNTFNRRQCKEP